MDSSIVLGLEKENSGTSPTGHKEFDRDGYLVIEDIYDPDELYRSVPEPRQQGGSIRYDEDGDIQSTRDEVQVPGSVASYNYPQYKKVNSILREKIENIIGKKLYETYYYDRFYYPKQQLDYHIDRPSCEISVSVHIGTNLTQKWPFIIKTPDTYSDFGKTSRVSIGESSSLILKPGDGVIYKGCERPHWRTPMPLEYERKWFIKRVKPNLYYHQVFFHYVLQDGRRCHHAYDKTL